MTILGRFGDTSGRPYVEGRLFLPRLAVDGVISFLVDTGADNTTLMPTDGRAMRLRYDDLRTARPAGLGAGGEFHAHQENGVLVFTDGEQLFGYFLDITILPDRDDMLRVPSLLGRDILHRWSMHYHHAERHLAFEVRSTDTVIPASGPLGSPLNHYR